MAEYDAFDPFSVCFNLMKIKYKDYDESLTSKNFLNPTDKVNVFINLETCFKHLSTIDELERKIMLYRGDFDVLITSNILNLAGHYKRFFINNGLDTKVYLYNTAFESETFNQRKYNEDFRTFYLNKFNSNPKYVLMTDILTNSILPDVEKYCQFIPNVYYISARDIEGSLVPFIIANDDPRRKNLIISGEKYDTQYTSIDKFVNHYIHKGVRVNCILSSIKEYIKKFAKGQDDDELDQMVDMYSNYALYCSLLSIMEDKSRSIEGIPGIGPRLLYRYVRDGIQRNEMQLTTSNPEMIGKVFHDKKYEEEFINNYYCTSIVEMYEELTPSEKASILNQRRDRFDMNSLMKLNNTRFANHPLILESLSL